MLGPAPLAWAFEALFPCFEAAILLFLARFCLCGGSLVLSSASCVFFSGVDN